MKLVVFILFIFSVHTITYGQTLPDTIPMNRIRILASHNSYKRKPNPRVLDFLKRFESKLGPENNPDFIDYGHLSFKKQFNDYGIRGIELDVNYDPKGGHYKRRRVNLFLFGQKQRIKDKTLKEILTTDAGYTFQTDSGEYPFRGRAIKPITLLQLVTTYPNARFNVEIKPNNIALASKLITFIEKSIFEFFG